MNSRIAFPFLTLSDAAVEASPWHVGMGTSQLVPAGDYLPDWDYTSSVRVRRTVSVNRQIAAADLEIDPSELSLAAALRVGTGQGRLPRSIIRRERLAFENGSEAVVFDTEIPGSVMSTVLDLHLEVLLDKEPAQPGVLSPNALSDRVWHDTFRMRLEGEEPRFPIEVADLRELLGDGIASAAPWYLHWSPRDWTRDFHGALRLYLNTSSPETLERIESEDPETLRALMADVMGQICERYIAEDDMEGLHNVCEPGSLGAQAASWLDLVWPGKDLSFVRSLLVHRPGRFRSAFLALAEQRGGDE